MLKEKGEWGRYRGRVTRGQAYTLHKKNRLSFSLSVTSFI